MPTDRGSSFSSLVQMAVMVQSLELRNAGWRFVDSNPRPHSPQHTSPPSLPPPYLAFQGIHSLFLRLTPPGDRWCGVLGFVLWPQVESQAPQHFRSSETQAICDGCMLYTQVYLLGCDLAVLPSPIMCLTSTLARPLGEKRAA